MAIEPLGSIMTVQAQPVVPKVEPVAPVESTEAVTQVQKSAPDPTTLVVKDAKEKGDGEGAPRQQDRQPSNEQIRQAVEKFNKSMISNSEAVFGIHEDTNRVTIKIVDKSSKEVIKELPAEKTLDMIARVWEMAGILVDEKR